MRISIKHEKQGTHVLILLYVSGALAGRLRMRPDEWDAFSSMLWHGAAHTQHYYIEIDEKEQDATNEEDEE